MNNLKYFAIASIICVMVSIISCDDNDLKPSLISKDGINILIGDEFLITSDEIDYYDQSSHLFYLKGNYSNSLQVYGDSKYWILSDGEPIYDGTFITGISWQQPNLSTMQFDYTNSANFVLKLNQLYCEEAADTSRFDPRLNADFISELKRQGIYHNGLVCSIDSVIIGNAKEFTLYYRIENRDEFNFYVLDQEKIPSGNQYNAVWTTKLYSDDFAKRFQAVYSFNDTIYITNEKWNMDWMTLIKSGESKYFSKNFQFREDIMPGNHWLYITIPSLGREFRNVEEIQLDSGRIWLGEFELFQKIQIR